MINKYAYYIVAVALLASLVLFVSRGCGGSSTSGPTQPPVKAFYHDEETGEESVHATKELPPLMGKNGKRTLVRVFKYRLDDDAEVRSYFTKYSDEALEEILTTDDISRKNYLLESGRLIRLPGEGQSWLRLSSPEGERLHNNLFPRDSIVHPVTPD